MKFISFKKKMIDDDIELAIEEYNNPTEYDDNYTPDEPPMDFYIVEDNELLKIRKQLIEKRNKTTESTSSYFNKNSSLKLLEFIML